ncbi:flagellar hook-associated protein FlgK [Petrotoga sp. 9PWA.NaAc.5.4]|uniref:flagellar hook-associated protein FlgK n=1 Tax=Petrotoga sp. 9PWA.NaAc.5.4 TaxID=1434328 RepID=UPI000CAACA02|nr:flagellar hook-associated protein FlgK [Petrotoga sp. 9PWA.NaAc.5.4]PNR94732.1 hypothetical protein X924_05570 [Petrotoga sp. 9PWA.NaAc.5.4]
MCAMTLYGMLNTGLLGVYTNKVAMSVTAHNIANANTPGFSRQTPVMVTNPPIYLSSMGGSGRSLSFGTGATVADIQRIRDEFLDLQFRETSARLQYWENIYSNIHYIEQLFGEPGETGLRNMYDSFWASIEELKSDPSNEAAKAQIVFRADELINTMKDLDYRLQELANDINSEIKLRIDQINGNLERIADLNQKILTVSTIGGSPNDLLDERDRLLDQLAELSDIRITTLANGQMSLSIGDKVILNGSHYQKIHLETLPQTGDYYQAYVGNSPLTFGDGKMKALFELRDEIIPSYRKQLDEFGLYLVDTTNLIYKEGWDATGTIKGAQFFTDISTQTGFENSRLFRIAGNVDVFHSANINYVTSNKTFYNDPLIDLTDPNTPFNIFSISSSDVLSGSSLPISVNYDPTNNAIYLESTSPLEDKLILDLDGSFFKQYGFAKKEVGAYKIDVNNVIPGSLSFVVNGNDYNINFSNETELVDNINSNAGGYLKAFENDGYIYIVPTEKVPNYDLNTIVLNDVEGSLSQMEAQRITLDALDISQPTLNNLLGSHNTLEMSINGIRIEINPLKDNIYDLIDKINATNTGVTASITPQGKFILRAGNFIDFDMQNVTIKGPENLFKALGLIETTSNNIITLISPNMSPQNIEERFSKADLLRIDNTIGIINQINVSQNLKSNPSLLAIDLGYYDGSNYYPTGPGNVSVWNEISKLKNLSILDNGRIGFSDFLANIITDMGVKGENAYKMRLNSETLNSQISLEKERVMGVSIDEEMANIIKYQQAFNASARVITAIDQMLGTVINNLGTVGR